jgi:hypothetical protein
MRGLTWYLDSAGRADLFGWSGVAWDWRVSVLTPLRPSVSAVRGRGYPGVPPSRKRRAIGRPWSQPLAVCALLNTRFCAVSGP